VSALEEILRAKRARVRELRRSRPWGALRSELLFAEPRRSLSDALRRPSCAAPGGSPEPIRFLCEIKRASPSAGPIRLEADAPAIAAAYRDGGAAAVSVVTEEEFFRGRPSDLATVRTIGLPLLMKDFFLDPWQIGQARALGADAILLIVAALSRAQLDELAAAARELGLDALIEVHTEAECEAAARVAPGLIGVNNRDLDSLRVDLRVSERLLDHLPPDAVRLSESGIGDRADVVRLDRFDGLLVGERLMRARDPGRELRSFRGVSDEREREG